jgi:hypothetical protein
MVPDFINKTTTLAVIVILTCLEVVGKGWGQSGESQFGQSATPVDQPEEVSIFLVFWL